MPRVNDYSTKPIDVQVVLHSPTGEITEEISQIAPRTNRINKIFLYYAQAERNRLRNCREVRMVFTLDGKLLDSSAPDKAFTNNEYALFGKAIPRIYTGKGEYQLTRDIGVPHPDNWRYPGTNELHEHQNTKHPVRLLTYERTRQGWNKPAPETSARSS
jgi:hypothetical protein